MKQRGSELLVLLGLLALLVFAGVQMLRPPESGKEEIPHRTTYSAKPSGWKAFFLVLQERGYPVTRLGKSPTIALKSQKTDVETDIETDMLIVGPEYQGGLLSSNNWTEKEARATLEWVNRGGTLLLISEIDSELSKVLGLDSTPEEGVKGETILTPTQPAPFFLGVKQLILPDANYVATNSKHLPLVVRKERTPLLIQPRGKGSILWIGSSGFADNKHLGQAQNARFLDQYIRYYASTHQKPHPTIAFDEYHQGKQTEQGLWDYLGRTGQSVVWQISFVVLLAGYSAAVRFGLPRPLPRTSRVSAEYVSSVADLYQRAGARDLALSTLYNQFWNDLCRAVDREPTASVTEIIKRAARLTTREKDEISQLEERLGKLIVACKEIDPKIKETEMLQWAKEIESLRVSFQIEPKIS